MRLMKNLLFVALLLIASLPAFARGALFGWAERGGYNAISSLSGTSIPVQRGCPSATITVRLAGSVTSATIYSDAAGTAKSNPFTATTAGYWHFYADDADYDVLVSCGVTYSYTIASMRISGTGIGVDVRSMGAVCDGTVDDTVAVQAAVNVTGPHNVLWPNLTCKTTNTITVSQPRVNIIGTGQQSSINNFVPTSGGKAAWHFTTGINAVLYQNRFEGMTVNSSNTTFQKFGILATDTSMLTIENVAIYPFSGGSAISPFTGGGNSAAIKLKGRERTIIREVYANSDIPLWIDDNPNFSIDVDHLHVEDFYAAPTGTNPIVYISSGVNLTNVLFDGDQTWVTGARGLYWVDTATTITSNSLVIKNVRYEQPTAQHFVFEIQHNQILYNLVIENALWGGGTASNGIKLRNVVNPVIRDSRYNGTGTFLDVTNSVQTLELDNVFTQAGGTSSMGTLRLVDARANISSTSPHRQYEYWQDPAGSNFAAGRCSYFMGEQVCAYSGTLANSAVFDIPTLGGGLSTGSVRIRYKGATKWGEFIVYIDNASHAAVTATTDTSRSVTETGTGNIPGRITVMYNAAANIDLWNQLGESVVYTAWVTQN